MCFDPPPYREKYLELRQTRHPDNPDDLKLLKINLMRRAYTTLPYYFRMKNEGESTERMYKRGMLTDDVYFEIIQLKKYVEEELNDVARESEELSPGWSKSIWQEASQHFQVS